MAMIKTAKKVTRRQKTYQKRFEMSIYAAAFFWSICFLRQMAQKPLGHF